MAKARAPKAPEGEQNEPNTAAAESAEATPEQALEEATTTINELKARIADLEDDVEVERARVEALSSAQAEAAGKVTKLEAKLARADESRAKHEADATSAKADRDAAVAKLRKLRGEPAGSRKRVTADATERQRVPETAEPALDRAVSEFCGAMKASGAAGKGMLSRPHVLMYRSALRMLQK